MITQFELQSGKPIMGTFRDLAIATAALHLWQKPLLDSLHDIWKLGAPLPDSRILDPRHYDPRLKQSGNLEKRIIFPIALAKWVKETSEKRGMPLTERQAWNIANGRADYAFDQHSKPLVMGVKK